MTYCVEEAGSPPDWENFLYNEDKQETTDNGEEKVVGSDEGREFERRLILHEPSYGENRDEIANER